MINKDYDHIKVWFEKTKWKNAPKAVCKPCWEIKYCPYGPLVEDFPLKQESDEKSCRIFGHDCPVFYVAEPFTETRELRNITRNIPRVVQFKVLKRENQVCAVCRCHVSEEEIEFDHIIPWSKGGSSNESNIRLLCSACNKKRGNSFENEYLVYNVSDHIAPHDISTLQLLLMGVSFGHDFLSSNDDFPTAQDYADSLAEGDLTRAERFVSESFKSLFDFFQSNKPYELTKKEFESLKLRWGFSNGSMNKICDVIDDFNLSIDKYVVAERNLLNRLGVSIDVSKSTITKWKKT